MECDYGRISGLRWLLRVRHQLAQALHIARRYRYLVREQAQRLTALLAPEVVHIALATQKLAAAGHVEPPLGAGVRLDLVLSQSFAPSSHPLSHRRYYRPPRCRRLPPPHRPSPASSPPALGSR